MKNIELFYEDTSPLNININSLKEGVNFLITHEEKKCGQISIIFCSDEYLLTINKKYLKHDFYTDIVTFDYVENDTISGDLFISVDRVKENAEKFQTAFSKEIFRVVFHGILHLAGYNDKTANEKKEMRAKENFYLCNGRGDSNDA